MIAVQIGANLGNDDFTKLIQDKNISKLILVEPISECNDSILKCYEHIENKFLENIIVSDKVQETETIYFHKFDTLEYNRNGFELASLNPRHSLNIRGQYEEKDLLSRACPNMTINQLFERYNLIDIDILYTDTEGSDSKIIKSIDFSKFNIKEIYYENLHIDANDLREYLKNKGYQIEERIWPPYGWSDRAYKQ